LTNLARDTKQVFLDGGELATIDSLNNNGHLADQPAFGDDDVHCG
jgi:hypothetical protein